MILNAHLNAIATSVPTHNIHKAFVGWAQSRLPRDKAKLFGRMAARSGISNRWSVLPIGENGTSPVDPGGFYADALMPGTEARMALYASEAPKLALEAVRRLQAKTSIEGVSHLIVASCTGFVAPGVDQIIAARLGLSARVERTLIGFMGCYAASVALRTARHIVRSDPSARVLVVTVELSTLHLQDTPEIEPLLAMLQFGDGAAAALVSAAPEGFLLERGFSVALPDSADLICWDITDHGFAMHLSGEVPGRIAKALSDGDAVDAITAGTPISDIDGWAVHAGGRSILDAVEGTLSLAPDALTGSRAVLADNGNMSSSTLMFALERLMDGPPVDHGIAIAFGPGLAAEGLAFKSA